MEEMQNVNTQRRCRQQSFNLQDSQNELDISYQSLPNSMTNRDEITEFKIKLDKLTMKLQIANSEIDNLNVENNALRKELSSAMQKINMYKSVGALELNNINKSIASPLKFYSPQYIKRKRSCCVRKRLTRTSSKEQEMNVDGNAQDDDKITNLSDFFEQPLTLERDLQNTIISHQPSYRNIVEKCNVEMDAEAAETGTFLTVDSDHSSIRLSKDINTNTKISESMTRKHQVKIFADQTGLEIRSMLQELLGNSFQVTSVVKPGAPMAEVISSCVQMCKELTKSDYLLILGGSNDSNPLYCQSFLCYTLNQVKHTNVLVGKLYKNKYLNVKMLNNSLKLTCSNFTNTIFLPLDLAHPNIEFNVKYINTKQACRLIHREILRLKYRNEYLNYVTINTGKQICKQMCYNHKYTQTENETSSKRLMAVTNSISTQTNTENNEFFRT